MTIQEYIESVARRYALGNATEHTYRSDLQQLIESLQADIQATNEPKRIECGAPDYVLTKKEVPVGYIEAKDVGEDLGGSKIKEQRDRYREALDNLIFTDYLEFRWFVDGTLGQTIRIGEVRNGKVVPLTENFDFFASMIKEFCNRRTQTIKSSKRLAEMMADKAKMLAYVIKNALDSDEQSQENSTLKEQLAAFKQILIHDIDEKQFADVYAQTIAYGMFAARFHDRDLETFTRQEAAEKIPKTNPFLRKLFQYIAGYDLDDRIKWIVDALADVFRAANVRSILKNFGKSTQTHDPIMHFYETFLAEYDPKLRKARGVYYTPEPVVDFIVRAVDDILKTEFGLPAGLADTSKIKVKHKQQGLEVEREFHKVQILDPATGTGTFLAQVIKQIHKSFENQQGVWNQYVDEHLIPRLNGFELLMASYAMAHLKLDLLLNELSGEQFSSSERTKRFQVYLTNALEEHHPDTGKIWETWLSAEANEANHVKRDTPVMVVLGNPPYSGESSNKGDWIMSLMEDYKKEPGGKLRLEERNPKWINDDYVKFVRFGQSLVERNGEGILAFINPHGFVDNPTFRGIRWKLLTTFDKIYVIDLHGNSIRKETSPDGSPDENVFDIKQGVSINVFVKTNRKNAASLAEYHHTDVYGSRAIKYDFLANNNLRSTVFQPLTKGIEELAKFNNSFLMRPFSLDSASEYYTALAIADLFNDSNMGITSGDDRNRIAFNASDLIVNGASESNVKRISYRPFDSACINYDPELLARARFAFMQNFLEGPNLAFCSIKRSRSDAVLTPLVTDGLIDKGILSSLDNANIFPLYLYPDSNQHTLDGRQARVPNLKLEVVEKIADGLGLAFVAEPTTDSEDGRQESGEFAPIDLLDYIYAVLHSPTYREKYKEFLKIDFPRVPYPKDAETFWALVKLGGELREVHLLESAKVSQFITGFPVGGSNEVEKPVYKDGRVYFNKTQYFDGVPEIAWNFYIGGYQPAQKWLKDRKGRTLSYDDIQHYQKIIVALTETDRIMTEIDEIDLLAS